MMSPLPVLAAYKNPGAVEDNAIDGLCRPHLAKAAAAEEEGPAKTQQLCCSSSSCRHGGAVEKRAVDGAGGPPPGLDRSGKSCRLRWVNYLHPDLKHGRMTPQEELLVLQLHAKWGNRWSRIARCLPGRTDNEIKNYWRTHMRKKAQERSMLSVSSPPSSPSSSSSHGSSSAASYDPKQEMEIAGLEGVKVYSMDQIWDEIAAESSTTEEHKDDGAWCVPAGRGEWCQSPWKEGDEGEQLKMMMMTTPLTDDLDIFQRADID